MKCLWTHIQMIFRAMMLKPSYEIPMDSASHLIQANKVVTFKFHNEIQILQRCLVSAPDRNFLL